MIRPYLAEAPGTVPLRLNQHSILSQSFTAATKILNMELHQRILQARKQKGLTQEQLSELSGITVRSIQRIEAGETSPRAYTLKAMAQALDLDFDSLLVNQENKEAATESDIKSPTADEEGSRHFFQLLCLSCFSYLVVPYVHFLIPAYLLRKYKEQDPAVIARAKKLIRAQTYWQVSLHLLLFCTLAYNLTAAGYFQSTRLISYLLPFFAMYFINVFIISHHFIRGRNIASRLIPAI